MIAGFNPAIIHETAVSEAQEKMLIGQESFMLTLKLRPSLLAVLKALPIYNFVWE